MRAGNSILQVTEDYNIVGLIAIVATFCIGSFVVGFFLGVFSGNYAVVNLLNRLEKKGVWFDRAAYAPPSSGHLKPKKSLVQPDPTCRFMAKLCRIGHDCLSLDATKIVLPVDAKSRSKFLQSMVNVFDAAEAEGRLPPWEPDKIPENILKKQPGRLTPKYGRQ